MRYRLCSGTVAFYSALLMSGALAAQPADNVARAATPADRLEEVVLNSPKHAAVMPYDDVFVRLKRMRDSKLDRVTMQIKIVPQDEATKLSAVRVAIVNDRVSVPVPVGADGTVTVPYREDLYKTDAELRSNQPKGSLKASLTLGIGWSGGREIPYHEVEETVRQLQVAGKDLLGWFGYMLFFPSLQNVEVPLQYPEPRGQTMRVVKDGMTIETYTADAKGQLTFKLKPGWAQLQPTLVFSEAPPKF